MSIIEYTKQLPGTHGSGTKTVVAGNPVWEDDSAPSDPASVLWYIQAPDGGFYTDRVD